MSRTLPRQGVGTNCLAGKLFEKLPNNFNAVAKRGRFHKAHTYCAGIVAGFFDYAAAKGFSFFYSGSVEIAGVGNGKYMLEGGTL